MSASIEEYAKQYATFEDERTRPVRDLVTAIPTLDVKVAVDIGCGPGNSTEVLASRFPRADISGIDSAPDMVVAARKRLPGLRFEQADVAIWDEPGSFDVILANASLQWAPNHATLFPRLIRKLSQGGCLAVQMPDNMNEPAHKLTRQVADEGPWAQKLTAVRRTPREGALWYYELLKSCCSHVDVWQTTYYHSLTGGAAAVVDWFKGSALRPYLAPLDEDERLAYLERYKIEVVRAYPALSDGSVLLPFPRLFMVALR